MPVLEPGLGDWRQLLTDLEMQSNLYLLGFAETAQTHKYRNNITHIFQAGVDILHVSHNIKDIL